jgi:hypothetical protein
MSTKLIGLLVFNIINDWRLSIKNIVLLMINEKRGWKALKKAYHTIFNRFLFGLDFGLIHNVSHIINSVHGSKFDEISQDICFKDKIK